MGRRTKLKPQWAIHSKSVATKGSLLRPHSGSMAAHSSGRSVNFSCRLKPRHRGRSGAEGVANNGLKDDALVIARKSRRDGVGSNSYAESEGSNSVYRAQNVAARRAGTNT